MVVVEGVDFLLHRGMFLDYLLVKCQELGVVRARASLVMRRYLLIVVPNVVLVLVGMAGQFFQRSFVQQDFCFNFAKGRQRLAVFDPPCGNLLAPCIVLGMSLLVLLFHLGMVSLGIISP